MVDTAAMAVAMVDTVDTAEIVVVEDLATALEAAMADLVAVDANLHLRKLTYAKKDEAGLIPPHLFVCNPPLSDRVRSWFSLPQTACGKYFCRSCSDRQ